MRQLLSRYRPDSIRSRTVTFAILAALIPSAIISMIAYAQNRRALTEKITYELVTTGAQSGRETDVWLKERIYDLRVFANSYVVSETLAKGSGSGRLAEYLASVRKRFSDYEELQLVDAKGRLVGSSSPSARLVPLPINWRSKLESSRSMIGEPYLDERSRQLVVVLAVPVERADGRISGALVARANFASLAQMLRVFGSHVSVRISLVTAQGRLIADSRNGPAGEKNQVLDSAVAERLQISEGSLIEFRGFNGEATLGSAHRIPQIAWLVLADMPTTEAYAQAARLRNVTLLVTLVLLVLIGIIAYRFAALITRPLDRLASAAAKISSGDLSVNLPQGGSGEVGYLTQVFNTMVESLRRHRADLERLSTTDSLTGLTNRRHLMHLLASELERAKRDSRPFSVLMLDVDHFKKYNDDCGHLAGDEVLARMGMLLRDSIGPGDCAARYGGEEFLVMLAGSTSGNALSVANRIRQRIREEEFSGGKVTISVGVAEYPLHGLILEAVISKADEALYEAKRAGRNRVVCSAPALDSGKREPIS